MKILPVESRARLARAIDSIKPKSKTPDEEIDDPLHDIADYSSESNIQGNQLKEVHDQCRMLYRLIRPIDHAHARWEWAWEQEREQERVAKEADQKLAELSTIPAKNFLTSAVDAVTVLIPRVPDHEVKNSDILSETTLIGTSSASSSVVAIARPELVKVMPPLEKETREVLKKLKSFMDNAGEDLEGDLAQRNPQAHQAVVFILEHMTFVLGEKPSMLRDVIHGAALTEGTKGIFSPRSTKSRRPIRNMG
jgi:hypothetical protein